MNRKTLIIISSIFIIVVLGVVLYFYLNISSITGPTTTDEGFPVGRPAGDMGDTTDQTGTTDGTDETTASIAKLQQISKDPVSGSVIINKIDGVDVFFTDRMTGHTLQTNLENISLNNTTNTTIPKIYESIWSSKGDFTVLRYLKDETSVIQSFIGKVSSSSLVGKFLPINITQVATNPIGDKIFYLYNKTGSLGFITDSNLAVNKQVFSSPAKEWIVTWPKEDTLTFTTKASASAQGYMFTFNTNTKSFDKVLGGLAGLTTLTNGDLTKTVYSESSGTSIRFYTYTHKTGEVKSISPVTLPEKCVWSKINTNNIYCAVPKNIFSFAYPDVWYQGLVSFNDEIWLIETDSGETTLLNNLSGAFAGIDATNLQLDKNEEYLIFINKKDLQLWSLNLK
ncbi:MAG: hypothetical protein WAV11_03085 [Minisyncoccia bacterium]